MFHEATLVQSTRVSAFQTDSLNGNILRGGLPTTLSAQHLVYFYQIDRMLRRWIDVQRNLNPKP